MNRKSEENSSFDETLQLPLSFPNDTQKSSKISKPKEPSSHMNNENESRKNLTYVMIRSYPMISIMIGGKERVCLAQISSTLLKKFSYNEIHNRRVALGINCIQCTPGQLELLRSAGAMPISSRRCGMITKREAERLVKSFLDENKPPCLPENFAFEVHHKCGYGCRGTFYPSRYNSSRAKCIKCAYCNVYFSPNKFIFHYHETPNAVFIQSNTINFNSWRRHIQLVESNDDQLNSAWEDVKSIFNSGKRKRNPTLPMNNSAKAMGMLSKMGEEDDVDEDEEYLEEEYDETEEYIYSEESENEESSKNNINNDNDEDELNVEELDRKNDKRMKTISNNEKLENSTTANALFSTSVPTASQLPSMPITSSFSAPLMPNIFDFLSPLNQIYQNNHLGNAPFPFGLFPNKISLPFLPNSSLPQFPIDFQQQQLTTSMNLYLKAQQDLFKKQISNKLLSFNSNDSNSLMNFSSKKSLINGELDIKKTIEKNDTNKLDKSIKKMTSNLSASSNSSNNTNDNKKKKKFISIAEHFE